MHICLLIVRWQLISVHDFFFSKYRLEQYKVSNESKSGNLMSEKEAAEPISNYLEAKECCLNTFEKEHS